MNKPFMTYKEENEQLTARIERLNYSLAQETALSDRLKVASRMPGTGNYVEWIETIRNSHDQVEQLTARVRELEESIESHAPEGRNYTNRQVVEMRQKFLDKIATLTQQRDLAVEALEKIKAFVADTPVLTYQGMEEIADDAIYAIKESDGK